MLPELFIKSGYKAKEALNLAVFHFFNVLYYSNYMYLLKIHHCISLLMPS